MEEKLTEQRKGELTFWAGCGCLTILVALVVIGIIIGVGIGLSIDYLSTERGYGKRERRSIAIHKVRSTVRTTAQDKNQDRSFDG